MSSTCVRFFLLEALNWWAGAQGSSNTLMSEAALGTEEKLTLGLQSIEPHAVVAGLNNPMINFLDLCPFEKCAHPHHGSSMQRVIPRNSLYSSETLVLKKVQLCGATKYLEQSQFH